jgi:hypothetical protein
MECSNSRGENGYLAIEREECCMTDIRMGVQVGMLLIVDKLLNEIREVRLSNISFSGDIFGVYFAYCIMCFRYGMHWFV